MKPAFKVFLILINFLVISYVVGQKESIPSKDCGTMDFLYEFQQKNQNAETEEQFEEWMARKIREGKRGNRSYESYTIPVIFHIVHNGEEVGTGSNLPATKIQSQLAQLNADFANANIPGSPYDVAADIQIQFCLALFNSDGTSIVEPGINRINRIEKSWIAPPYSKSYLNNTIKQLTIWDSNNFLNIWILSSLTENDGQSINGFSTFPVSSTLNGLISNETDLNAGICVDYSTIGSLDNPGSNTNGKSRGRTLTHEAGHFFGLKHIWGDKPKYCNSFPNLPNCNCNTDYCEDTPVQRDYTVGCITSEAQQWLQNCPNIGDGDKRMFENYMDYTPDLCRNTFTMDQKLRMQTVMANSPRRVSLGFSNKCCPQADLTILMPSVNPVTANANDVVTVGFAVQNSGATAAGQHVVSFHLSSDDILTPGENGDTYIGEYTITGPVYPLSQTILLNHELTIPSGMDAGTYYLFMSADGAQAIPECDELNNFATVFVNINTPVIVNEPSWRYWFDGQFNNAIHQAIPSGQNNYDIQKNINIAHLTNGLHTLHFQLMSEHNKWSSISSSFFYKSAVELFPVGSPRYQYWINNYDYRATVNISSSSNFHLIQNIDMEDLEQGLHTFHIRFKPDGKHWSSVSSSFFYKPKEIFQGPSKYEYWYDDDYEGKVSVDLSSVSNFILLNSLSTDNLTEGLHKFNIRFRPDGKNWSSISSTFFYKPKSLPIGTPEYQYWLDNDFNDAISTEIPPINNFILLDQLDYDGIPNGLHVLHFRFRIDGSTWSSIESSFFVKDDKKPDSKLTKCVYWFDDNWSDPFTILFTPSSNVNAIIQANTDGLSSGIHTVSMFFQDDNGLWSSIVRDNFEKSGDVLYSCPEYQKFVSGMGSPSNISYQWQVNTGSGYVNINNSTVYGGSTTDTLTLSNAPKEWYGYLFRCNVTTNQAVVSSIPVPLRFVYYWNGTVDDNWETSGNWHCNNVPGLNADVIINSGKVEVNTNVVISSLTVSSLVDFSVNTGFVFNLKGH